MERNTLINKVFDVVFVALTPVENTGQVSWNGDTSNGAYEALVNHLTGVYGPGNFKIVHFKEAEEVDSEYEPFEIPFEPPTSKVIH